jgi:ATP-dependent DNA helicase RecQ
MCFINNKSLNNYQVDSFKRNNNNFKVVAISGYLTPLERKNALVEVENGVVDILYLAPESLRSNTIFKVLKNRIIERFIIDEAHCFSSWGHDFRHDYHFIATTIKELEQSEFQPTIPVSCFTATAKPEVVEDIKRYFKKELGITLNEFIASVERYNLAILSLIKSVNISLFPLAFLSLLLFSLSSSSLA